MQHSNNEFTAGRNLNPEQALIAKLRLKAAQDDPKRAERLTKARRILQAAGSRLDIETLPGGGLIAQSGERSLIIRPDTQALEAGTIFQTPAAHALNSARQSKTLEAQLVSMVLESLPAAVRDEALAVSVTKLLLAGLWDRAGSDEHLLLAAQARRDPVARRTKLGRVIAQAEREHGQEGAKRVRQALNGTPALLQLLDTDELIARAAAGQSPVAIVESLGGSKAIRDLSRFALPALTRRTLGPVCAALSAARAASLSLPKGKAQRHWLQAMAPVHLQAEPAEGFFAWLATATLPHSVTWSAPHLYLIAAWAEETAGERGGWQRGLTIFRAGDRAHDWSERQARAKVEEGKLPDLGLDFTTDTHAVAQLTSTAALVGAGAELGNCLGSMSHLFAKRAKAHATAYYVVRRLQIESDGESKRLVPKRATSAIEVALDSQRRPVAVLQHEGPAASHPRPADIALAHKLIALGRESGQ